MRNEGFGLGVHCPYIALKISGGLSATGVRPIISMELLSLALVTSRVRKTEKVAFGSVPASTSYLSSKKLRMAAKMSKSQGEVWDHVAETQQHLSKSLGKSLHAAASPMRSARWMPFPTSSPWLAGSTTSAFSAVRSPGWRAPASRMITGAKPVRSSASTEPITTHTPRSMDCDIPTPCTS